MNGIVTSHMLAFVSEPPCIVPGHCLTC